MGTIYVIKDSTTIKYYTIVIDIEIIINYWTTHYLYDYVKTGVHKKLGVFKHSW
jgi:hypothetical protein